ncbi:MAG TPA: hypothetical protein VMR34_03055 [Candidatus Saccharimonadales bacterium]|nr:hypothetical protein [Candidatus Saccharimonadales bacterium]
MSVTEEHIDHCLTTLTVYLALQKRTKSVFNIASRYEIANLKSLFPEKVPDLYLFRKRRHENKHYNYSLDIFDAELPFWVMRNRIRAYQDHCDGAELEVGETYPYILLVALNERTEQRLIDLTENIFQDFDVYTTTVNRLFDPDKPSPAIWREVFEEGEDGQPLFRGL